jgi:hypothetical protein
MPMNGAALDTRLQSSLLFDPKLQRRLSGDEFRSFINILVYSVTRISDGVFAADETEMFTAPQHLERLIDFGLVEVCEDSKLCRIHPHYQKWQSSKAEIDKVVERKERDRERKAAARRADKQNHTDHPEWEPVSQMQAEPPF